MYPLPDVEPVLSRERVGRQDWWGDGPLLVEAFFVMRHYEAMNELRGRLQLGDEEEIQKLLREVVAHPIYRRLQDVYVRPLSPEFKTSLVPLGT